MWFLAGSIVKRRLDGWLGLFWHMGIYVGNGRVIHFNGDTTKAANAVLINDALSRFAAGKEVVLHKAPADFVHGRAICQQARRLCACKSNPFNGRYDFVFNNCERFVIRCFEVVY